MTPSQLRKALEAWRTGDSAALKRVMAEAQGPLYAAIMAHRDGEAARHEFDVELIQKPDGSYGV